MARQGKARHGWLGAARQSRHSATRMGEVCPGPSRLGTAGMARFVADLCGSYRHVIERDSRDRLGSQGVALCGSDRTGTSRCGAEWQGRHGVAWISRFCLGAQRRGLSRLGKAGVAWHGEQRIGAAEPGEAMPASRVADELGMARPTTVLIGKARLAWRCACCNGLEVSGADWRGWARRGRHGPDGVCTEHLVLGRQGLAGCVRRGFAWRVQAQPGPARSGKAGRARLGLVWCD